MRDNLLLVVTLMMVVIANIKKTCRNADIMLLLFVCALSAI